MWLLAAAILVVAVGVYAHRLNSQADDRGRTSAPPSSPAAPGAPSADGTRVVNVVPLDADGAVTADFSVQSSSTVVEGCSASRSAVGPGVVGCSPSAANAGVCWVTPDQTTLLCGEAPWSKVLIQVTSEGPVDAGEPPPVPEPWGLELATGERCGLRNGGAWPSRDEGYNGAYWCEDSAEVVLVHEDADGTIDRSDPTWRVFVGSLDASGGNPRSVEVVVAYFASAP